MSASYAFKGYDNFVVEDQIESILSTKLDMNRFMTADYSLEGVDGTLVKIHRYTGTGEVDDLDRGEGNTHFIDAEYTPEEYRVKRTQGQAKYFDVDAMMDSKLIESKIQYLAEGMANDWTKKAINEFDKTENQSAVTDYSLGSFADTIAKYTNVYEDQEGLFFLCNIELVPALRKMLGDYLKYTEGYIKTGAIGDILGVPVYVSKAVPKDIIFCANAKAVTAFIKKGVEVEQDRNIDTKENYVVASRYSVIALTDESRCIKMGKAQATPATITTATSTTVAGACTTGSSVTVYVNGVKVGTATGANSAYSVTLETALVTSDIVKVVAKKEGFLPSIVKTVVA